MYSDRVKVHSLWQHRENRAVVRIEAMRGGLVSFSVRHEGEWKIAASNLRTEAEFQEQFEPFRPERSKIRLIM